ncbi:MAG: hypothetical protein JNG83_00645 [Opitutaceae bacterium]|nr:hypothetical protein [Opitutaceae bacterium]
MGRLGLALAGLALCAPAVPAEPAPTEAGALQRVVPLTYFQGQPLVIGNRVQLLVDDFMVEDRWKLRRRTGPVSKYLGNPIMVVDKPWEDHILHPHVIHDPTDGKYKMWYTCANWGAFFDPARQAYYIAYAESRDGFTWTKPELFPFEGHARTNVVRFAPNRHVDRLNAYLNVRLNPDQSDPRRKYWASAGKRMTHAYSPDGVNWEIEGEPMLDYGSDFSNQILWVEETKQWYMYLRPSNELTATGVGVRTASTLATIPEGNRHTRRRVSLSTSPDLKHWSKPRVVLYPDERDTPDFDVALVFRRHDWFIGFYDPMYQEAGGGEQEIHLATSRDGIHWQRTWDREPFVPRGPAGSWDHGHVSMGFAPPVEMGDNLLFYYTGSPVGQGPPLLGWESELGFGIFKMRKDRFVGHWAERDATGYLLTRQFILDGSRLRLNCLAPPKAYDQPDHGIFVEILQAPASGAAMGAAPPVEGFTLADCDRIRVDQIDRLVTWRGKSDLSALKGKAVYLRFQLKDAALYSFQIEP